jgi:hypothetical protein
LCKICHDVPRDCFLFPLLLPRPAGDDPLHVGGFDLEHSADRIVGLRTKTSDGTATCKDLVEYADAISSSIDPLLASFGLPAFSTHIRSIALETAKWEEQGKRLHPGLNIINQRSFSQFLGMICANINVQPSEIRKLNTPEELAGFVDVALQIQAIFPKSQSNDQTTMGLHDVQDDIIEAIEKSQRPLKTIADIAKAAKYTHDSRFGGFVADLRRRRKLIDKVKGHWVVIKKS